MTRHTQCPIRLNYCSSINLYSLNVVFKNEPIIKNVNKLRLENACDVLKFFIFNGAFGSVLFSYKEEEMSSNASSKIKTQHLVCAHLNPLGTQIERRMA
jgi:hypothetical protein